MPARRAVLIGRPVPTGEARTTRRREGPARREETWTWRCLRGVKAGRPVMSKKKKKILGVSSKKKKKKKVK